VRGHTHPQPATQRRGWPPPRERGHLFTGRHQCNNKGPATGRLCSAAVADGHLTEGMLCSAVLCLSGVVSIQGVEVSAGETGYPLGIPGQYNRRRRAPGPRLTTPPGRLQRSGRGEGADGAPERAAGRGADLPASIGYVGEVPRKGAGPGGHPPGGWTEGSATDTKGRRWWTIIAERRRGPGKRGGGE
jgi:hypothetical protein